MKSFHKIFIAGLIIVFAQSCQLKPMEKNQSISASEVLKKYGPNALSFGGYRHSTRDSVPSVADLKEDMRILNAMGCHLIRTYHTQMFGQQKNLFQAIDELNQEDSTFKMYVMMGAWIECKNAWTEKPNHQSEDSIKNRAEIDAAIHFAKKYPEIVKIIAVGNEAMVHWATGYFVKPGVILKYVNELQNLKVKQEIDSNIWITSSDNFASWGGGSKDYHQKDLTELIQAVDYVSLHTYPFHDTHYNSDFWILNDSLAELESFKKASLAMQNALAYAQKQYQGTKDYIASVSPGKEVHIGETGWASMDDKLYGKNGSMAADPVKQRLYYKSMREWCNQNNIACFYFQAFNEPWKDASSENGSENHFGLFTVEGNAKYAIWEEFDQYELKNLKRANQNLSKTFKGDRKLVMQTLLTVPDSTSTTNDTNSI